MRTFTSCVWLIGNLIWLWGQGAAAGGLRATDDLGNVLEFERPPQRLVSLAHRLFATRWA